MDPIASVAREPLNLSACINLRCIRALSRQGWRRSIISYYGNARAFVNITIKQEQLLFLTASKHVGQSGNRITHAGTHAQSYGSDSNAVAGEKTESFARTAQENDGEAEGHA